MSLTIQRLSFRFYGDGGLTYSDALAAVFRVFAVVVVGLVAVVTVSMFVVWKRRRQIGSSQS